MGVQHRRCARLGAGFRPGLDSRDTEGPLRSAMTMSPDAGGIFDTLLTLVRRGLGGTSGMAGNSSRGFTTRFRRRHYLADRSSPRRRRGQRGAPFRCRTRTSCAPCVTRPVPGRSRVDEMDARDWRGSHADRDGARAQESSCRPWPIAGATASCSSTHTGPPQQWISVANGGWRDEAAKTSVLVGSLPMPSTTDSTRCSGSFRPANAIVGFRVSLWWLRGGYVCLTLLFAGLTVVYTLAALGIAD